MQRKHGYHHQQTAAEYSREKGFMNFELLTNHTYIIISSLDHFHYLQCWKKWKNIHNFLHCCFSNNVETIIQQWRRKLASLFILFFLTSEISFWTFLSTIVSAYGVFGSCFWHIQMHQKMSVTTTTIQFLSVWILCLACLAWIDQTFFSEFFCFSSNIF